MERVFQRHQSPMLLINLGDGRLLDANLAALKFYGYDRQAMLALRISDINILSEEEIRQEMGCAASEHRNYFFFRHRLANGDVRDVEVHSSPVETGTGKSLFSIVYDISERRRVEAALARSEAFSRAMLAAIPLPLYYKDTQGRYVDCNPALLEWTGLEREQLLGRTVYELWPPEQAEQYAAYDRQLLEGEVDVQEYEGQLLAHDGRVREVLFHKACVHDAQSQRIGVVGVALDITERKQMADLAHQQAMHDELTRLPNRRKIRERLQQTLRLSTDSEVFCALLYLDLDNFKPLNDTHGHDVGDLLLKEVAKRLKASVRLHDMVGRMGGDEFVVILEALGTQEQASLNIAQRLAERIRLQLGRLYQFGDIEHQCTASIGLVLFQSGQGTVDSLLHQADQAMYQAKTDGRNRVCSLGMC